MPALLTRTSTGPSAVFGRCHEFLQRSVVGHVGRHADRLAALADLARLRKTTLAELMKDLGIPANDNG